MLRLNHIAGLAVLAFVTCPLLMGEGSGQDKAHRRNWIDRRSVWTPTQRLRELLNFPNGKRTKESLFEAMKGDRASPESISFAISFSTEAAYLSAMEAPNPSDGFTVGEVIYPFRETRARTFVILNATPRIIDVSDPRFLKNIDLASSEGFKKLWASSLRAECVWSEPQEYEIQPGAHNHTEVLVSYPIKDVTSGNTVGTASVAFEFSYPGRKLLGTKLEYVEKKEP
jgi:hypothetical protein